MKKTITLLFALCLSLTAGAIEIPKAGPQYMLRQSFLAPPDSIRVGCYYYWVNEQVDPKGVVADLQWMKDNGITMAFFISYLVHP